MLSLEITNLPERIVLRRALWRAAAHALDDHLDDLVYEPRSSDDEGLIDQRISAFLAVRASISTLDDMEGKSGPLPFTWTTDLTVDVVRQDLGSVGRSIAEDESFWRQSPEDRVTIMAEHDAAEVLIDRLQAVA
jgi:hypothetical protein